MAKTRTWFLATAAFTAAATYAASQRYRRWRQQLEADLIAQRRIAHTQLGAVEYQIEGTGPVLLQSHGGPGGCDHGFLLEDMLPAGFTLLTPSRPGYLGTPLHTGRTIEAQADAFAALLDALGIEKAAAVGVSAGGPVALSFAIRHPDRVWALVMLSGVSERYLPNEAAANSALGHLYLNSGGIVDVGMWLLDRYTEAFPAQSLRQMLATESSLDNAQIKRTAAQVMRDPQQVAWFKKLIRSTMPLSLRQVGLSNDLAQLAHMPPLRLEEIAAPTLVVHGLADADVPYKHALNVAQRVPGAQLHTQERSGHLIWLGDEWRAFRPNLIAFLNQHAPVHTADSA